MVRSRCASKGLSLLGIVSHEVFEGGVFLSDEVSLLEFAVHEMG